MAGRKKREQGISENGFNQHLMFGKNPTTLPNTVDGIYIFMGKENRREVVLESGGEVVSDIVASEDKSTIADRCSFIKLYPQAQKDLFKLTHAGLYVLSFIFKNLIRGRNEIEIHKKLFSPFYKEMEAIGKDGIHGQMTCYRGILNLLETDFIYRKVGGMFYFINVNKFYNGNRLKLEWIAVLERKIKEGEQLRKADFKYDEIIASSAKSNIKSGVNVTSEPEAPYGETENK